ncbi:hypothetical protein [Azospirillum himalayense]|uniref:Uncharacterized protein n=1 Tax=Azospirillum himalayense TaxID=654847 RepID=A0ABW0G9E5_9PROT
MVSDSGASRKIRRAAKTLKDGQPIWEFLKEPDTRDLLIQGAEEGEPSVAYISSELLARFGTQVKEMPVRQFVGMAVKAVMAEAGYRVAETGVRIPEDPVFKSGAVYEKVEEEEEEEAADDADILTAMLGGLDAKQLRRLIELAEEALAVL